MNFDQFDEYQQLSAQTDQQKPAKDGKARDQGLLIPLLGLAGETGTLLAEFKKRLRDGRMYEGFDDKAEEELGDILWYLSNVASRLGISLSKIVAGNLLKTQERWPIEKDIALRRNFDDGYPGAECLPRTARIKIHQEPGQRTRMEWVDHQCFIA